MTTTAAALALSLTLTAQPWDAAFTAEPAALRQALAALDAPIDGAEVDLLLEEALVDLDAAGLVTSDTRLVFVPRTAAAVRGWGTVTAAYSPWYQSPPELRARVITPDGESRWLDQATLSEAAPDGEEEAGVLTDRRILRAPLPGLAPGALVEERVVLRDRAPFFAAGTQSTMWPNRPVPARRFSLRVSAPADLPLRWKVDGLPAPVVSLEAGRRVLRWDVSPLPAGSAPEYLGPPDQPAGRRVLLSTARSWAEVAAAYRELAERQLAGADVAAVARGLVARGDAPLQAAQKVLDFVASKVRYTGLSLGDRSIVPGRPDETLARGYGDCKDMSLLSVALLRAAGHEAALALVPVGLPDPDPELPGLAFDHAVVRVGGRTPIWFDPTDPTTPAGGLPIAVQGRLALPIRKGAGQLERTPASGPADNGWSKVRRIEVAEAGLARASETGTFRGAAAADVRRLVLPRTEAERQAAARERLDAPEGAAVSLRVEAGPGHSARLAYETDASRWGVTGDESAEAVLAPDPVLQRLPPFLWLPDRELQQDGRPPAPRRTPLHLPEPYTAELRYEVVPPPGFRAGSLPAAERVELGAGTLEGRFAAGPDGTVIGTWRFTASRRRLAPAEVDTLRRELLSRLGRSQPVVRFHRISDDLLAAGKGREAVAELLRLAALHPAEARHRCHLAIALLTLGLGAEARAEARRAAALEPAAEWPLRVLALTLQHDLLGQPFGPDADLPGAIEALRRAVQASPASATPRLQLARLLEQGRHGRYGPGARLDEALAIRRAARDELHATEEATELAALLLAMERPGEALEAARAAPPGADRHAVLLAAAAVARGEDGFYQEAAAVPAAERVAASTAALQRLLALRRYELVGGLTAAGLRSAQPDPKRDEAVALIRRARPVETLAADPKDPARLHLRVLAAAIDASPEARVRGVIAGEVAAPGPLASRLLERLGLAGTAEMPRWTMADLLAAGLVAKAYGDGPPWRIAWSAPGASTTGVLAVQEGGEVRLVAVGPSPHDYATAALRAAERGELAAARRLLGWALERKEVGEHTRAIWQSGPTAGQEELILAAASFGDVGTPEQARALLRRAEAARATAAGPAREALRALALDAAFAAGDLARARAIAEELGSDGPGSPAVPLRLHVRLLVTEGRFDEARAAMQARLLERPDDRTALGGLSRVEALRGDHAGAARAHRQVLAKPWATLPDFNNAAWTELYQATPGETALAWAQKAAAEKPPSYPNLHTLAAVQAWTGRPAEAMATLREAVQAAGGALQPGDWLVVGRVAEAYGLPGAAREAYLRIPPPAAPDPESSYELARLRLDALEAARRSP